MYPTLYGIYGADVTYVEATESGQASSTGDTGFSDLLGEKLSASELPRMSPDSPLIDARMLSQSAAYTSGNYTWSSYANYVDYASDSNGYTSPSLAAYETGDYQMLGDSISSFTGSYFKANITVGESEQVGQDIDQFHFPHLVEKDGTYYAYFIDHSQGSENDVGLATSTDGVNFTYQGKVLTKGEEYDALQASFPSVQYDDDTETWYMLYEAKADHDDINSVCLATSSDGYNWTKQGPVISPGAAGAISEVDVGTPTMFKEDGQWHVYFHTLATDGRVRIGYATGTDLTDLSVQTGALLDTDSGGYESGTVGARSNVVKVGSYYYMAYEACTSEKEFGNAIWSTNLARSKSPDGPWEKLAGEPLLTNSERGFGMDGPELSVQDGEVYLYYRYGGNSTARVELSGLGSNWFEPTMAHQA